MRNGETGGGAEEEKQKEEQKRKRRSRRGMGAGDSAGIKWRVLVHPEKEYATPLM